METLNFAFGFNYILCFVLLCQQFNSKYPKPNKFEWSAGEKNWLKIILCAVYMIIIRKAVHIQITKMQFNFTWHSRKSEPKTKKKNNFFFSFCCFTFVNQIYFDYLSPLFNSDMAFTFQVSLQLIMTIFIISIN